VLDLLDGQPEPLTVGALVAATGLHENTVREHLEALVDVGLVERSRAAAQGRGRPAWLYRSRGGPETSEYAGLASALAGQLQRRGADPAGEALEAGQQWGRQLARRDTAEGMPQEARSNTGARRRVVALLDDLGFEPRTDDRATRVELTRCPLLEAAHRYPGVVCGVHLGIVRGALEEYGGQPDRTDLVPFAAPGSCRLDLLTRQRRSTT